MAGRIEPDRMVRPEPARACGMTNTSTATPTTAATAVHSNAAAVQRVARNHGWVRRREQVTCGAPGRAARLRVRGMGPPGSGAGGRYGRTWVSVTVYVPRLTEEVWPASSS
ncbi:hypothetical protein GCM10007967_26370 [Xylanimonas ulmi]